MTATITSAGDLIVRCAENIAFASGANPAADLDSFTLQLESAANTLTAVGIAGAEDLMNAAHDLTGLEGADEDERALLLKCAAHRLRDVAVMVDKYRDVVCH